MQEQNFRLILVSGLPGAGKTTLAKTFENLGYILLDDPVQKPSFLENQKYILTDPHLCFRKTFDKVNALYPKAKWLFFEPSAITCWQNVQRRLEKEPHKVITYRLFSKMALEYEKNFSYYLNSVRQYEVVRTRSVLV